MLQQLKDIKTIAESMNVPVSRLYQATRTNEIPHYKIGKYVRFDPEEVKLWLECRKVKNGR